MVRTDIKNIDLCGSVFQKLIVGQDLGVTCFIKEKPGGVGREQDTERKEPGGRKFGSPRLC